MKINRVCMIGGTGFVGHALARQLSGAGYACRIVSRHPHRHRDLKLLPGVELTEADVFNPQALRRQIEDCDAVVNLVGILNEAGETQSFRRVHVALVDSIVDAMRDTGVPRLLHMSAVNAHADKGSSEYLRTKGEGEDHAHHRGGGAVQTTSFRPSVIFGPGDSFFNRFATLLRSLPGPFPLACPETRFAPIYAGDVALAFQKGLEDPTTIGQRYDLCGPEAYTLRELVVYTARTLGMDKTVIGLSDRSSRLQARILGYLPGRPFTYDNYLSMQTDSLCRTNGLQALGITPTPIESIVPLYLSPEGDQRRRYRRLRSLAARADAGSAASSPARR